MKKLKSIFCTKLFEVNTKLPKIQSVLMNAFNI